MQLGGTIPTYHNSPPIDRNWAMKLDHPVHNIDGGSTIRISFNVTQSTNMSMIEQ